MLSKTHAGRTTGVGSRERLVHIHRAQKNGNQKTRIEVTTPPGDETNTKWIVHHFLHFVGGQVLGDDVGEVGLVEPVLAVPAQGRCTNVMDRSHTHVSLRERVLDGLSLPSYRPPCMDIKYRSSCSDGVV